MSTLDPSLPGRRDALVNAARRLTAEAGPEGGALLDPDLAADLAVAMAWDIGRAIEQRTAGAASVEELVERLLDAVLEASEPWRDALQLANMAIERAGDFEQFAALCAPWLFAVERTFAAAQERGVVRGDVDPAATALVLRDALDRTAKVAIRFRRDGYREATAQLVRSALRA
jgi:hypothetical protein